MLRGLVINAYDPAWPAQFLALQQELLAVFDAQPVRIEHIGSTAVPGLVAKPVMDLLLGVEALADVEVKMAHLATLGFDYVSKHEALLPMRRYFVRPAAAGCLRVHVHAVQQGSSLWRQHLAFRNALRQDPGLRARYAALKLVLAQRHAHDKAAYTDAKAPFIQAALAGAGLA